MTFSTRELIFVAVFLFFIAWVAKADDVYKAPDGSVIFSWTPDPDTGGIPLTGFDVYVTVNGAASPGNTPAMEVDSLTTSVVVDLTPLGLSIGDKVFFQATARNAVAVSALSDPAVASIAGPPKKPVNAAAQ